MSVSINGTSGLVFNDASTQNTAATGFGFKNRIINGAMMIDQRNAGASVTVTQTGSNLYLLDRWCAIVSQASKISVQQSSVAPAGFSNSILVTSLATTSVAASDYYQVRQYIEGYNIADLGWGTANAQTVTLSFWVRSSLTGTFSATVFNASANRFYATTYTVNTANTWEQKTITIAGDTSGTWLTTNSAGLVIGFTLGMGTDFSTSSANTWVASSGFSTTGATSVVGTNGATFYITGVQLEKGSTATSFDYRPYGTELALCQRYYWQCSDTVGYALNAYNITRTPVNMPVVMRSAPTLASGAAFTAGGGSAGTPTLFISTGAPATPTAVWIFNSAGNWTTGNPIQLNAGFNSEL